MYIPFLPVVHAPSISPPWTWSNVLTLLLFPITLFSHIPKQFQTLGSHPQPSMEKFYNIWVYSISQYQYYWSQFGLMIVKEITNCHWFMSARFSSYGILKLSNKLNDVEESLLQKPRLLRGESIYFNYYLCLTPSWYGTCSYVTYLISHKI